MVSLAARRHGAVRREPAEEVPGHLPFRIRLFRFQRALGRAEKRVRVLDWAWREDFPRRQSAHQALYVLGLGHNRAEEETSRYDFPFGGVHAAADHAPA